MTEETNGVPIPHKFIVWISFLCFSCFGLYLAYTGIRDVFLRFDDGALLFNLWLFRLFMGYFIIYVPMALMWNYCILKNKR